MKVIHNREYTNINSSSVEIKMIFIEDHDQYYYEPFMRYSRFKFEIMHI